MCPQTLPGPLRLCKLQNVCSVQPGPAQLLPPRFPRRRKLLPRRLQSDSHHGFSCLPQRVCASRLQHPDGTFWLWPALQVGFTCYALAETGCLSAMPLPWAHLCTIEASQGVYSRTLSDPLLDTFIGQRWLSPLHSCAVTHAQDCRFACHLLGAAFVPRGATATPLANRVQ